MPDNPNYAAYTYDELVDALFAEDGKGGGEKFIKAWPVTLVEARAKVKAVTEAFQAMLPELAKVIVNLTGPNGNWSGPAASTFKRLAEGMHNVAWETTKSAVNPSWAEMLDYAYYYYQTAREDFWYGYNVGWVAYATSDVVGGRGYQFTKVTYHWRWDPERAARHLRPLVINLAGKYDSYRQQFGMPPPVTEYEQAPPPKNPQEDIDKIKKEADKELEKIKKDFDDDRDKLEKNFEKAQKKADDALKDAKGDFEKAQKKSDDAFNKAKGDFDKQQDKANEAFNKAKGDFDKQLKDAQKPPGLPGGGPPGLPDGKAPGLPDAKAPGADNLLAPGGVPLPPGAAPVKGGFDLTGDGKPDVDAKGNPLPLPPGVPVGGVPVKGGFDLTGDGKPDVDEKGKPLPGFDPGQLKTPVFTPPSASPPPGVDIAPPVAPPPGTIVDKDGKVVPNPAILPPPGSPGGVNAPRLGGPPGSPGADDPASPRTPRFVRPPGLDDQPNQLNPIRSPSPPSTADGLPLRKPPALDGGNSVPFVRSPSGAGGGDGGGDAPPFGRLSGQPRPGEAPAGALRPGGLGGLGGGFPPMCPPMGGMGGHPGGQGMGGQQGERERQTWLLEDDEIWSDDDDAETTVLGRAAAGGEDEEEYSPQF